MREEVQIAVKAWGILTLILVLILLLFVSLAWPVTAYFVKPERHWFHYHRWYRSPEYFAVTARAANTTDKIKRVAASARIIHMDEQGEPEFTDEFLKVEPATTTIYPGEKRSFKIYFPIPKGNGGLLAAFSLAPMANPGQGEGVGIAISHSMGFAIAVSFVQGKYNPFFTFTAQRDEKVVSATVENDSDWVMEGILKLRRDEKIVKGIHFFIEPGKARRFNVSDSDSDNVLCDVGNLPRMLGIRLR